MDDDCENDTYVQSPFNRFMQNNDSETLDPFDSLSDLIKAHSAKPSSFSNQHECIDDFKANGNAKLKLSINIPSTCKSSEVNQSSRLFNNSDLLNNTNSETLNISKILPPDHTVETDDNEDFNTLAEYTKSFLHSKGNRAIPNARFQISNSSSVNFPNQALSNVNPDLTNVNKKLSQVHISDQKKKPNAKSISPDIACNSDNWNIDLSTALQDSKTRKLKISTSSETNTFNYESSVYSAHLKDCDWDISPLASEKLMYSNAVLSSFGYVLSRKWKAIPLAKRFRTIGIHWPYNASKSFKFDSPSPDDINLKNKFKTRTTSFNES